MSSVANLLTNRLPSYGCIDTAAAPSAPSGSAARFPLLQQALQQQKPWHAVWELIDVDACSGEELVDLYHFVTITVPPQHTQTTTATGQERCLQRLAFELKDTLLRRLFEDQSTGQELAHYSASLGLDQLTEQIERACRRTSPIIGVIPNAGTSALSNRPFDDLQVEAINPVAHSVDDSGAPRVLQATLEYEGARVGGVGSVATEMSLAMNENGQDARVITPLYDVYIEDYDHALEFVCTLRHPYEGRWVESSIYKTKTQNDAVTQYLVKPATPYATMNDIGHRRNVYGASVGASLPQRTSYFTAAAAAFGARYVGKEHNKPFKVLHTHSWSMSCAGALVSKVYNRVRADAGLDVPLATVGHVHGTGYCEQGIGWHKSGWTNAGLRIKRCLRYVLRNLQLERYRYNDGDIHVSSWSAHSSQTKRGGYGLHKIISAKVQQGRLAPVSNGINRAKYDPTNEAVFGDYAYRQDIVDGVDRTDYVGQRSHVKQKLYKEGLLADKDKPLFLFVGRFDVMTKGLDTLPSMVRRIHREGGQCVIMGGAGGDPLAQPILKALRHLQKKYPTTLRLYEDPENDQKAEVPGTAVQKGMMLRLASDFVIVPSHKDADGLVPKEALTHGALLITSAVEGLGDTAKGLGTTHKGTAIDHSNFNAFTYKDSFFFKKAACNAISKAMDYYRTTSDDQKNQVIGRLWEESKVYCWSHAISKINALYAKAMQPQTDQEKARLKRCFKDYCSKSFSLIEFARHWFDWLRRHVAP